jgi:homoserine dehydrogenase
MKHESYTEPDGSGRPIQIGFLGLGVVGAGAYQTLLDNAEAIAHRVGAPVVVRRIAVAHPDRPRAVPIERGVLTGDPYEVLNDPEISIICELIGGTDPAGGYVRHALARGKHVVTANKELIAREGPDILATAREHGSEIRFEGAVAGGIPILGPLRTSLAGNRIERIEGIVNGTTNYILTRMAAERKDFAEVLADAQRLGYAEADPTSDVDGWDAAYKMCILAAVGMETFVDADAVRPEGISRITERDFEFARDLGYTIKLLGIAQRGEGNVEVRVHPVMLRQGHPLANVDDVFNAVLVTGSSVGDVMFYGRGAGSLPTGSAVVGDIVEIARNMQAGSHACAPCWTPVPTPIAPMEDIVSRYYIRLHVPDRPKTLSAVAGALGDHGISIRHVAQHELDEGRAEIVVVTHPTRESDLRAAVAQIEAAESRSAAMNIIRVES